MIETRGLWRSFGERHAVQGLDLSIGEREIYGFLGPNGAGKTTTIRMLAGLLRPSRGELRIAGRSYAGAALELRRMVGVLPDTPPLYDYLTGRQYLALVAGLYGIPRRQRDADGERLLHLLELDDRADDLCKGYSYGMRKKIHLAAVLTTRPSVLLLDEATTGLDPRSARVLKDLVLAERARGATILFSTHVLEVAQELCDRIGILAGGRLRAEGSIAELRAQRGDDATLEGIFLELTEDERGGAIARAGEG
jgi:ABC-2 type transport system ATP-binding protein